MSRQRRPFSVGFNFATTHVCRHCASYPLRVLGIEPKSLFPLSPSHSTPRTMAFAAGRSHCFKMLTVPPLCARISVEWGARHRGTDRCEEALKCCCAVLSICYELLPSNSRLRPPSGPTVTATSFASFLCCSPTTSSASLTHCPAC
jgi:hypothetical protein